MAGVKRGSDAATELSAEAEDVTVSDNPSKKVKRVNKKKEEPEKVEGSSRTITTMERKKKRKELDKLKRQSEAKRVAVKEVVVVRSEDEKSGGVEVKGMPQLHIGVFKDLASVDESARESAAEVLVKELVEIQRVFEENGGEGDGMNGSVLEAEKEDGLDKCAPSVRYAVRRLIRGVSSSRECARQGFALGLAVVVRSVSSVDIGAILKLIVSLLEVTSSMKGQEVRDCYLGRLFAYGAVAGSGRLVQEWEANNETPYIKEFVSTVISLAGKKQYLQEPSVKVILELVEKV